ncbi:MAG: electron transport complex subunit RsxC [Gallionellaceae bacterium]|jgi:electron transport complex protein RnfC
MRTLHTFHGGVHPAEHKLESSAQPSLRAPLPQRLVLPLKQHIGNAAKALVQAGDKVLKGQLLAAAEGMLSAAIHAPTSGTVVAIDFHAVAHPSGLPELCIVLQPDGEDRWIEHAGFDYRALPREELLNRLRDAGIVGLGGATFPTHVKLNNAQRIQTLILNGAECEPWITTDDRLMCERAAEIVQGIEVLRYLAQPAATLIGIEDNKPEAITAMQQACAGSGIEVVVIPTLYPSGGEKQLIKILTGKEVPSGGRPLNIGVVCSNVATAFAIHRMVNHGEPLISRLITVTGHVKSPRNIEALIGTPIAELVQLAGGALEGANGYIVGGPMMGLEVTNAQLPVVKGSNCIIVKSDKLFPAPPPALPCIRCTRCVEVCPAELQPQDLYWFARAKNLGKAQSYHLFDCIECGACSYVCPSNIPLVQYYRFAKSEIWANERDKEAADLARERHEFHLLRIEREKQDKADKLAQKEKAALAAKAAAAAQTQPILNQPKPDPATVSATDAVAIDALRAQVREIAHPEAKHPKE